ncbi:hypothetical protein [Pyrococcus kukulkanii]|uniref:hypothetical protein n=1 Tax=Pyrococcus kukulkanii TaxID=1609559 RepID=UPI0035670BB0
MRKVGVVLVFVILLGVISVARAATITNEVWSNAIVDPGVELVPGVPAELNITIVSSNGEPFTAATFPNADSITVSGKFVDEYGNAIDVTGDGNPDIFSFTEATDTPGLWRVTINVTNVTPGLYTFRIQAIAQNSTTGEVFDNVTVDRQVWIAGGSYWVAKADVKDGDTVEIGSLSFTIRGLSDLGAILDLGNLSTQTITDTDRDGIFSWQYDVTGDKTNDWLVFSKSSDDDDRFVLLVYSNDASLLDNVNLQEDVVRAKGDRITFRNKLLKDRSNYKAYVVWDESWLAKLGLKAVDYYIIPQQGRDHWKEGWGTVERMDVRVIKRTTYLFGLIAKEEEVFSGNIWAKNVNIDNLIRVFGRWVGNAAYLGRGTWEILKGYADITIPSSYSLRERSINELAYSSEDFRWFNPILKPDKASLDWKSILGIEDEEEE